MNIDPEAMKMKAKLDAFFDTATPQDISALLNRTNYEFYKNVTGPDDEDWFECAFAWAEEEQGCAVEIPAVTYTPHELVPNRPIVFIGRGSASDHERFTFAADHEGLALAA